MWQPGDGDGVPTKGAWKICDWYPSGDITDSNRPPANVFLTDRILYAVVTSRLSKRRRHSYWPDDFTAHGNIQQTRPNRGDSVTDAHGRTISIDNATGKANETKPYPLSGNPNWEGMNMTRPAAAQTPRELLAILQGVRN